MDREKVIPEEVISELTNQIVTEYSSEECTEKLLYKNIFTRALGCNFNIMTKKIIELIGSELFNKNVAYYQEILANTSIRYPTLAVII